MFILPWAHNFKVVMNFNISPICNARRKMSAVKYGMKFFLRALRLRRNSVLCRVVTGVLTFGFVANVIANPTGMTVASGSATARQSGSQLTITTSQNTSLNWQSFNIAAGETTTFQQPSASSIVWNHINDQNPSQIYGSLQANGIVVLLNSSGFYFGPNSFVSAAGLVVSTANCAPPENSGGSWEFNGPPPLASIVNYGRIQVGKGGSAFLIADQIENHGTIAAPGGTVGLAAGQTVLLSERPDGRGMSLQVTLPQGSVDNYGNLVADAGTIALQAQVVNQNGTIQADSVKNQNGVIELVASDQLNLGSSSKIFARGDDSTPGSSGGNVTLQSGNNFSDSIGSQILTTGGTQGGNGGNVEISAPNISSLNSSMDASAQSGFTAGEFFLDPTTIILGTTANGSPDNSGTVAFNSAPGTLNLNVNKGGSFANFSQIILQATGNIFVGNGTVNSSGAFTFAANPGITWDLSSSTGNQSGQLTLEAGGNITFANKSQILDANKWSVTLDAGYDFVNNVVKPGGGTASGNIFLNGGSGQTGGGSIQMAGNINSTAVNLTAGQNILVGTGFVITTGGGGINAHALAGNIDTGSDAQGYHFNNSATSLNGAYDLSHGLGGISTEAGGDVDLTAGGNVTTVLPISSGTVGKVGYIFDGNLKTSLASGVNTDFATAGSGAYGRQSNQKGDVNIVAGGNVTGNFLVANGTGSIYAGVEMDASGNPIKDSSGNFVLGSLGSAGTDNNKNALALSLISGGWNVTAAQNIILQEVSNPNGDFDVNGGAAFKHLFDYALDDYVNLSAGHSVQLGTSATALPRADTLNVPVIYPSILNIAAGAGGVSFLGDDSDTYNQLILFPSAQGSLTINTTQGGPLVGNLSASTQDFNLIVSDSGSSQFVITPNNPTPFSLNDHAASPVHLGNPTPVTLNISGDMDFVLLGAPEAAQINVGGDMNNSRFVGMNLSSDLNQIVSVPVRKIDGSMGTATVTPGVTSINVAGNINNRGDITTVTLNLSSTSGEQAPDLSLLARAAGNSVDGTSVSAALLATALFYNPTTQVLTYQNIAGLPVADVLSRLQSLQVQKVDSSGKLVWLDPPNNTIPSLEPMPVSVLNPATAKALLEAYNQENIKDALEQPYVSNNPNDGPDDNPNPGLPPDNTSGYFLGGGGRFSISANSIDLGTTAGIQSLGVSLYTIGSSYPLAAKAGFTRGADVVIKTIGDLDMFSSSIASVNGGNISINAGGEVNVGSADFTVNSTSTRGIYTSGQSDVSVIAKGDINVNGSRIAGYDGGNVTVESLDGDINAGTGGSGFVIVSAFYVDPATHAVFTDSPTIPGSGILTTTFPARDASYPAPAVTVGNILVETPNGNVNANAGGIIQLALNTGKKKKKKVTQTLTSIVEVLSGYELRDSTGVPVDAADIANGTPVLVSAARNIDASGSGVIAQNAVLKASGDISGVIFAQGNIDVSAVANVNVTALAQGTVSASAGGDISGTIIGIGGISASGSSIDASLLSQNVSASGDTSGATEGFAQGTAANATSQGMSEDSNPTAATGNSDSGDDDDLKKKKNITLAQKVSRVTVLLPAKTN